MAIHRISFETMNFVSKGGTDGIEGFDTREETGHAWMDAVTCYGPGPKGIEHEGITMGFGNMDKVVVCAKCGKRLRIGKRSRTPSVDFSTTSRDTLVSNIKV